MSAEEMPAATHGGDLATGIAIGKLDQRVVVVEAFRTEQLATNERVATQLTALSAEVHAVTAVVPIINELHGFMADVKARMPEAATLAEWARGKKSAEDAMLEKQRKMAAQLRLHAVAQQATSRRAEPYFLLALSIAVGYAVNRVGNAMPLGWIIAGYVAAGAFLLGALLLYTIRAQRTKRRLRGLEATLGYPAPADDDSQDD